MASRGVAFCGTNAGFKVPAPTSDAQPADVGRSIIPVEVPLQSSFGAVGGGIIKPGQEYSFLLDYLYDYIPPIGTRTAAYLPSVRLPSEAVRSG